MCAALLLPNCRDASQPAAKSSRQAILFGNLACRDARMRLYKFSSNSRKFTRDSCPKSSLARNCRAILAPNPRWEGIAARFLSQNFAGKVSRHDSCPKSSLGRNCRAILVPKLRWEGIVARFLPQIFAGKVSRRDSCPKSSLGRCRGAILVPNPRWEGIAARFLPQNFAGKVSRHDSCRLAAATCLPPL